MEGALLPMVVRCWDMTNAANNDVVDVKMAKSRAPANSINGCVNGLVSGTAGCAVVSAWSAIVTEFVGNSTDALLP